MKRKQETDVHVPNTTVPRGLKTRPLLPGHHNTVTALFTCRIALLFSCFFFLHFRDVCFMETFCKITFGIYIYIYNWKLGCQTFYHCFTIIVDSYIVKLHIFTLLLQNICLKTDLFYRYILVKQKKMANIIFFNGKFL